MMPSQDAIRKAVSRLEIEYKKAQSKTDGMTYETIRSKDAVLARFQPIFNPENIGSITQQEFRDFLIFKNNKHWSGLQRMGPALTEDMEKLREALTILVDEARPIQERLDRIMPKSGAKVKKLGRAVVTGVLLIAYPDKYGPMNTTSLAGAEMLGVMPKFTGKESFGERYVAFNNMLLDVSSQLGVDLWTLDMLWYELLGTEQERLDKEGSGYQDIETELNVTPQARFGLERYLQEFIRDNWDHIADLQNWNLHEEDGDQVGFEYDTREIGRIDLLARHKTQKQWLVIELKRNQTSDVTVGQTLRYMGWVSQNLAKDNEDVKGMIICHKSDSRIKYALNYTRNVDLLLYEVEFRLHEEK